MKKLTGLLIATAAFLLVLPTPRAGAAPTPAGPFFLCVNTTAKPPLPNVRVVTSMIACLPYEFLIDLNPAPTLSVGIVCANSSVGPMGNFNQQATCPAGDIVLTGGYSCTDTDNPSNLFPVTVVENTFAFTGVTPMGWQTVGTNTTSDNGDCKVCVSCVPGACKDPSVCAP